MVLLINKNVYFYPQIVFSNIFWQIYPLPILKILESKQIIIDCAVRHFSSQSPRTDYAEGFKEINMMVAVAIKSV